MGYVFISYSTKEQSLADAMKKLLEKHGIQTWMAPGDIPAGNKYAQVINQAIKGCSCFILMLSNNAQNSVWVAKETERAVNYRKPIIPIQLENVLLNDEFELYISTDQVVAVKTIDECSEEIQKILTSAKAIVGIEGFNHKSLNINDVSDNEIIKLNNAISEKFIDDAFHEHSQISDMDDFSKRLNANRIKKCYIALGGIGCNILNHFENSTNSNNSLFLYYDTDTATEKSLKINKGKFYLFENFSQGLRGSRENSKKLLELSQYMDNYSDLYDIYNKNIFDESGIELIFVTTSFGGFGSGIVLDFQKIVKDKIKGTLSNEIIINTEIISFTSDCFSFFCDAKVAKHFEPNTIDFMLSYYRNLQEFPNNWLSTSLHLISKPNLSNDQLVKFLTYDEQFLSLVDSNGKYLYRVKETIKPKVFIYSGMQADKNNEVIISNSSTDISKNSFSHVFLEKLKIPASIVRIQKGAFDSALIKEIHISKNNKFYTIVNNELVDTITNEIIDTGSAKLFEY